YVLVAALDNWADVLPLKEALLPRLLEAVRLADPDPWRDQVRDVKNWTDKDQLAKLAATADLTQQSPQIVLFLVTRLRGFGGKAGEEKAFALVRQALLHHPADFWLHFFLGNLAEDDTEKVGCFRAALAVRPTSAPALNNLGLALCGK